MTSFFKLRTVAAILYATLAILWLAIPQSVTNWSREFLPDFVQPHATRITEAVESAANVTRVPLLYEYVRAGFQAATKK